MFAILRNLDDFNWLYVHDQLELAKLGNIQRIDTTGVEDKLRIACQYGHLDLAQLMINNGANNFNGGLFEACNGGHENIVQLIINNGANNFNGGLYGACYSGHENIAQLMIDKGANDFNWGIRIARVNNHQNIIDFLTNHLA